MAGFENADLTLTGRGQAMLTHAGLVTNEFFQLTGSRPMMGRLFTARDDEPAVRGDSRSDRKLLGQNPSEPIRRSSARRWH